MDLHEKLQKEQSEWSKYYNTYLKQHSERKETFKNISGITLNHLYTPLDLSNFNYMEKLGFPGDYPYTRGVYPGMYRTRTWSKRLLVGFEGPEHYNRRQREMLAAGQSAINFIPCNTFYRGYDIDQVEKELVGTCGTPVNTIEDMDKAFEGISLDEVSTAFVDPGPFTAVAMYFALAEKRGIPLDRLMGTTNQSDFISHYVSCNMYFRFSLEGHLKAFIDHVKFCTEYAPRWHPVSIIGQHFQDSGATPVQALAFTLATGIFYVNQLIKAGMDVDSFAPRLSFFFAVTTSLFEEVGKFRAARRMWAKIMKERFGAKNSRSLLFRFHVQSQGSDLTRQQLLNNITRVTIHGLAAVLGGAQSIHTDSYDEAFQTPSDEAARIALMTQNIIEEETGTAEVIDPLGGSYYVEKLTDEIEEQAWEYINKIDEMGGMLEAVKKGFIQDEIGRSAYEHQKAVDNEEKVIVGVNKYIVPEEQEIKPNWIKPNLPEVEKHIQKIKEYKQKRDPQKAQAVLEKIKESAKDKNNNIFETTLYALKNGATHGEVLHQYFEILGRGFPYTQGF